MINPPRAGTAAPLRPDSPNPGAEPDCPARPSHRFAITAFPAISILAAFFLTPPARAQFVVDSWTAENGLPQNSVLSVRQTSDGYLWFSTYDGLVRFDGLRFTVFNRASNPELPSNRFTLMFTAPDGALWAAMDTAVGLVRYRAGRFRAFTVADGVPDDTILAMGTHLDRSLFVETSSKSFRLRNDTVEAIRERRTNQKEYVSPSGVVWRWDYPFLNKTARGRETRIRLPADLTLYPLAPPVMHETPDGALWLAQFGVVYRLTNHGLTAYRRKDGVPAERILEIAHDRDGHVWLVGGGGVCRMENGRFRCFGKADGLSSNDTQSFFQDREGTFWVGTPANGLNRLRPREVSCISTPAGLPARNVYPILEDHKGDIWAGTERDITRIRAGRVLRSLRIPQQFYNVQGLYEDRDGRLWVSFISGAGYYTNGRFTDITPRLNIPDTPVWSVYQDKTGAFWFSTQFGLVRYDGGQPRRFTTADGLPGNNVKLVYQSRDGTIWAGSTEGIARLNGSRFIPYTERDGLASNNVRAIYEDAQGTLWFGTYDRGISRLRDGVFTNFSAADGLFSNGAFQILEDLHDHFWVSSNQGIYRVSRHQLEDLAAGRIRAVTTMAFGKSDGMLNPECNGGRAAAGFRARDGKLWFPTQDGVVSIDPETVPLNTPPPPVVIESAMVQGLRMPLAGGLRLEPGTGGMEIQYTGLSLAQPQRIRFRYRLENLDTAWVEAGGRRTAFYQYLPPGNYIFHVIAANGDGAWSQAGATLSIVVLPPYYQTRWFLTLALAVTAFAAWLLWRRKVRQLERATTQQLEFSRKLVESQEAERKRIAAELHDSLSQQLLVIKNRAALGLRDANQPDATKGQFDQIATSAGEAIEEVRKIAYDLRPPNLDRLGLTVAIEELIEKTAETSGLEFGSSVTPIDDALTPEGAIKLYRVIQESISNITRHARATRANLEIWREEALIHITISDNGCGFDPDAPIRRGLGLDSIVERVRMLGGAYAYSSKPGQGTTLDIRIPEYVAPKAHAKGASGGG